MNDRDDLIKKETLLAWFGASLVAAIGAVTIAITFAYAQFETKEHSKETKDTLIKQLDRMENKLDTISVIQQGRAPSGKRE